MSVRHAVVGKAVASRITIVALALGCADGPSGPGATPARLPRISFSIQPGAGTADSTGCQNNIAYAFSPHLDDTSRANFFEPGSGTPRTQCGAVVFNESPSAPGRVVMTQQFINNATDWQVWGRRLRDAYTGNAPEEFDTARVLGDGWVTLPSPGTTNHYFDAPANDSYDLISLAYRHGPDSATAVNANTEVNAKAQLWREITMPAGFSVAVVDNRHLQITWANRHLGRAIDSTEIWRNAGTGWQRVAARGHLETTFTDSVPVSGSYAYTVRHVTGTLTYTEDDIGLLSRPNSPAPADTTVTTLGPPAPTGLLCEGNFDPTIDCRWFNTIATDSTQIVRDGEPQTTVAPGVTTWTDSAVTRHNTYVYQVRHLEGGLSGPLGPPDTTPAEPVPPENLSCGRTAETTASCAWVAKEPADSVEIQRSTTPKNWTTRAILVPGSTYYGDTGLAPGVAYTYRVRHRRGSDASAWSNTDGVGTTWPEPYGPLGP